jgi:uncharacterized protein with HEPN domain
MQRDDLVYLGEMYDFALGTAQRADGLERATFDADEDLRLAIVQLLGWLGEAARRVSTGFKEAHPYIPWSFIVGMRWMTRYEVKTGSYPCSRLLKRTSSTISSRVHV